MRALILHTWLIALRDRLLLTMVLALAGVTAISLFLADQSLLEQRETATAFIAFASRLIIVPGMALFAIVLTQRSFDSGDLLLHLSRPVSRLAYIAALFTSLLTVAAFLVSLILLPLRLLGSLSLAGLGEWGAGLISETGVTLAFALFAGIGLQTIFGSFVLTLCFYLLARLTGIIGAIAGSDFHERFGLGNRLLASLAHYLTLAMPRLDLFSSAWLLHPSPFPFVLLLQLLLYSLLLLGCAGFDLQRRRF
jgi:hypothetical protein